jgi:hypothetical protein
MFIVSIARRAVLGELDVCCHGALTILLGKEGVHCRCGKLGWAGCSVPIQVVSSVTMLVRGGSLAKSMPHYPVSQIESHQKVMVLTRSTVVAVTSETSIEEITVTDATTGDTWAAPVIARFTFIGAKPHTDCVTDAVVR